MADYSSLKVPELKKLLQERSLPVAGNKADLIARLQEHDKANKPEEASKPAASAEDVIDWDDEDEPATTTSKPAEAAKPAPAPAAKEPAVASKPAAAEPSKEAPKETTNEPPAVAAAAEETTQEDKKEEPEEPEKPKVDFSAHLAATDPEAEVRKRAERAKKYGIEQTDDEKKLADRAKKFGLPESVSVIRGLDEPLPERRPKRGREGGAEDAGRDAKQRRGGGRFHGGRGGRGPRRGGFGGGRREGGKPQQQNGAPKRPPAGEDAAKLEARAKRFAAQ